MSPLDAQVTAPVVRMQEADKEREKVTLLEAKRMELKNATEKLVKVASEGDVLVRHSEDRGCVAVAVV